MNELPHGVETRSRVDRPALTAFTPPTAAPGRELRGRTARSSAIVHGQASILLGVVPLVAGLLLLGVTSGVLGERIAMLRTPRLLAALVALLLLTSGLLFALHGWRDVSRARRMRRVRTNHPDEPWLWDHAWNAFASFDETRGELRHGLPAALMLGAFLVPFNWIVYSLGDAPWVLAVVTGAFDAILLLIVARFAHLALRLRRQGTSELRLPCFPCTTGTDIELKLVRSHELASVGRLRATLRCIQERYETRGAGRAHGRRIVAYALHESVADGEVTPGGEAIVFRFPVPPDAAGSSLAERPPRYWELSVAGEVPDTDYEATFLVPIYARPA